MAEKRGSGRRGLFVVVDGLDGVGKGEVERVLIGYEQRLGKNTFDSVSFSKAEAKGLPELSDFWLPGVRHYHTIITAEPTYWGIGEWIRKEMIANNGRDYSSLEQIQSYSMDRLGQMRRVVIPALENGLNVIQSRCCASTLCYQSLKAEREGKNPDEVRKGVLQHPGNILQLEYRPDLLIIPKIKDVSELIRRLDERSRIRKRDDSEFENLEFQGQLNPFYESDWLREIFEERGTIVKYLDAGVSEQSTREQAIEIYKNFLASIREKS